MCFSCKLILIMLLTKLKKLFYSLLSVRKLTVQCKEQGKTKSLSCGFGAFFFFWQLGYYQPRVCCPLWRPWCLVTFGRRLSFWNLWQCRKTSILCLSLPNLCTQGWQRGLTWSISSLILPQSIYFLVGKTYQSCSRTRRSKTLPSSARVTLIDY